MVGLASGLDRVRGKAEEGGHATSQLEPADPFGAGEVENSARRPPEESRDPLGDRLRIDGGSVLVGEEPEATTGPERPGDALAGGGAWTVATPDHEGDSRHRRAGMGGEQSLLPGELRAAVGLEGRRRILLAEERAVAGEDHVGREGDEPQAARPTGFGE